ncbi:hypothetical protein AB0L47_24945 [Streptomyces bobili]|uniref:hypothetical protein n=1 Tax=Streptomyces bobili TaxID=67280 RepID=UPI00342BB2A3
MAGRAAAARIPKAPSTAQTPAARPAPSKSPTSPRTHSSASAGFSSRSSDTSRTDLVIAGQEELVHLLDWALAAATRPTSRRDWNPNGADGTLQHRQQLPDRDGTLTLTASTTGVYRVSLEALGDPPGQALGVQS